MPDGTSHPTRTIIPTFSYYMHDRYLHDDFLQLPLPTFDLILGMPWLRKYNPTIDWSSSTLTLPPSPLLSLLQSSNHHPSTPLPAPLQRCRLSTRLIKKALRDGEDVYLLFARVVQHQDTTRVSLSSSEHILHAISADDSLPSRHPDAARLIDEFRDVFPDDLPVGLPPERFIDHKIKLQPDAAPTFQNHRRLSPRDLDELREHLDDLLKHGFIRASHSPYGAPVVFAKKANDTKRRFCVDYRDLNTITIKDKYPIPRIDELLDRLHGAKYFTKLDLRSGYHQVRVAPADVEKTAFNTRYGQFEFLVLPFGLTGAPSTFMHLMNQVLNPFIDKFVVVYLDDILIYSQDLEQHKQHVRAVLEQLRKHKLYAKESKCELFKREVTFLGFIVGAEGLKVDPAKVKAVLDWPVPTSVTEVRSFLGFVGFYRKFIRSHSAVVAPMSDLTKTKDESKAIFVWTSEAQQSFDAMKIALTSAPVLSLPNPDKSYIVTTDASGFATGACLMQEDDKGALKPLCFMSKKMLPAECNYPVHHKEMLAIICALKEWRHYLHGSNFKIMVRTDHRSLVHFRRQPNLSERQARWSEFVEEFGPDLVIEYQQGKDNVAADALSRRADHAVEAITGSDTELYNLVAADAIPTLSDEIAHSQRADKFTQQMISTLGQVTDGKLSTRWLKRCRSYTLQQVGEHRLLVWKHRSDRTGRVYIPVWDRSLQLRLLVEHHDVKLAGHLGVDRTHESLKRNYYWQRMHTSVKDYVDSCIVCQRVKHTTQAKAGLMKPHAVPVSKWATIALDFIGPLPLSGGYDYCLTVTDKLTKMVHLIPTYSNADAVETAHLVFNHVVRYHGLPSRIISDRDPKFTSRFWGALWSECNTTLNLSTAFHPQTDGQSERTNKTVGQMLRAYADATQQSWSDDLPYLEIAINNSVNGSTGYSPFYLMYGQNIILPNNLLDGSVGSEGTIDNAAVDEMVSYMRATLALAREKLEYAALQQKKFADRHRRDVQFNVDELVWLSSANITTTAPSPKLSDKWLGPFRIVEVRGNDTYRLALPPHFSHHDVFNVAVLKPYLSSDEWGDRNANLRPPPVSSNADGDVYEVEAIAKHRMSRGRKQYLVRWRNYPAHDATWEDASRLTGEVPDLVDQYERSQQRELRSRADPHRSRRR
jgi:hypothetical protein